MVSNFQELIENIRSNTAKRVAVVTPEDPEILQIVSHLSKDKSANFLLLGDPKAIEDIAQTNHIELGEGVEIEESLEQAEAANRAVAYVKEEKVDTLMKGMLHTSIFLRAVLNKEKGLNIGKTISQISVVEKPDGDGLQFITDCAISIAPTLDQKVEIIENAVALAHRLGIEKPKVAVISALEVVNPNMPDTLEAAILAKMADRGQIKGCVVDGPLALDNAVSRHAAQQKQLQSKIQGDADILLVPNLVVGNVLSKSIAFYGGKSMAAAVGGLDVPIIMTSRSELLENKELSIHLANYLAGKKES